MVVGLDLASPELSLGNLVSLLGDDLPAVVLSDDPITKMYDSLPMVLFRFEILVKLYEARELAWVAYFFPWVLLNEGTSHKQVDTYNRVGFRMAHIYLMTIRVTYESRPVAPGVKPFGRKAAGPKERRPTLDYKSLIHTTSIITEMVYEIKLSRTPIHRDENCGAEDDCE
jgi:cytochrome c oxidase assembly factor CtaG